LAEKSRFERFEYCGCLDRVEEKPAVDRHGDPLPRTHADKQSAVTLLRRPRSGEFAWVFPKKRLPTGFWPRSKPPETRGHN
jgi:hypothetical protein